MQSFVFFKYLFTIAVDVNMFWWLWFKHNIWYQEGWKIIVLTLIPVHLFNVSLAPALACSNRQQRQKIIWQRSHFCHHSGAGLLYSVQWKLYLFALALLPWQCLAGRNDTILCTSGAHRVQHVGHPAFTCDTSSEEKMEWRNCVF